MTLPVWKPTVEERARVMEKLGGPLPYPDEVIDRLAWHTRSKGKAKIQVHFVHKDEESRGEAWAHIRHGREENLWRKTHSKNYWVWYRPAPLPTNGEPTP